MQNDKWLKTDDGEYVNVNLIESLFVSSYNRGEGTKWGVFARFARNGIKSESQAQKLLWGFMQEDEAHAYLREVISGSPDE